MKESDMTPPESGQLDGRVLEVESHVLLDHILATFSALALSDEEFGFAMERLMQRWVYMMFVDCPEMMDGTLDQVGQFVCEDIAEVCDGDTDHRN